MNVENLRKKSLNELVDLKNAVESVCEDYTIKYYMHYLLE